MNTPGQPSPMQRSMQHMVNSVVQRGDHNNHNDHHGGHGGGVDPFIFGITVFALACFIGYYVVWRVTPALHTPLMAVTNAVSGIIIVGAIIAVGGMDSMEATALGIVAITLASVNIFGGFIVTQRMLQMFRKKEKGR